jgi:hypothetical protein
LILLVLIIWVGWEIIKGFVYRNKGNEKTGPFSNFKTINHGGHRHHEKTGMGLFDRFKKNKEPDYDPNNLKIEDLRVGFMFDYDLKTWVITEEYEYDWGDNYFTREYKLESSDDIAYLHIDYNDEGFMTINKKLKIRALGEDIPEEIEKNKRPPKKIAYDGVDYLLDKESPGYFSDDPEDDDSWTEFISWDYYDADGKLVACVEQWGEREFEASHGKVVNDFEITNILPGTV